VSRIDAEALEDCSMSGCSELGLYTYALFNSGLSVPNKD